MTNPAEFWNKRARRYAARKIGDQAAYEHTLERTRSYLGREDRVLELGCGSGTTALLLAPSVAEITGTDVAAEMVRIAREKAADPATAQPNARFRVAAAEAALDGAGPLDAVLAFNLLHLVPDPAAVIAGAWQALRPGGVFISKTGCIGDPSLGLKRIGFGALLPLLRLLRIAPPVHFLTFSGLEDMIAAAGFELVETGSFPAMSRYVVARKPQAG